MWGGPVAVDGPGPYYARGVPGLKVTGDGGWTRSGALGNAANALRWGGRRAGGTVMVQCSGLVWCDAAHEARNLAVLAFLFRATHRDHLHVARRHQRAVLVDQRGAHQLAAGA